MTNFDYDRPFIRLGNLALYVAIDRDTALRYGRTIRATPLSNSEYNTRFNRFRKENNMRAPPGIGRKFAGYLVVRKLGTPTQYETWMPDHIFDELYRLDDESLNRE